MHLEIGRATENHFVYVGHCIELLRENPETLIQVLGEVRQAVELIVPMPKKSQPLTRGVGSPRCVRRSQWSRQSWIGLSSEFSPKPQSRLADYSELS